MQIRSIRDRIDVRRRQCQEKMELERKEVALKVELARFCEKLMELDQSIENPEAKTEPGRSDEEPVDRMRNVAGHDEKPSDLIDKLDKLECRIAQKEKRLVEIDMLIEAMDRVNEKTEKKARAIKEDSLKLSKNMNRYQTECRQVMKELRALTAELSMKMAESLQLERLCKEKEEQVLVCQARVDAGEAPSDEFQSEWYRLVKREKMLKEYEEKLKMEELKVQMMQTADGVYTTAAPRPNAYVPQEISIEPMDTDQLTTVAKPYSKFAPFKPAGPSANMRHMRKPKLKPIEI
ncbi:hypothetical protein Ciccas_005682 [Cichlidogyrus casuarinus]|uniref:Uncharacterized protein n=1 Tax=Cichlidogyrus casuarinus TaxID=1844966 RepID=A0ABD2Q801_9PLAT